MYVYMCVRVRAYAFAHVRACVRAHNKNCVNIQDVSCNCDFSDTSDDVTKIIFNKS